MGGNIELIYHWPGAELDQVSVAANEIAAMRPDLVVSRSTPATAAMRNRGVSIVFVLVADPTGSGFVQNLARPGGTLTGFSTFESSVGGKWLGLLKEAAPAVTHVSLLFNPETAPFADGYLHSAQGATQTLGVTIISAPCGSAADIEAAFAARARESGTGGIIGLLSVTYTESIKSTAMTRRPTAITTRIIKGFPMATLAVAVGVGLLIGFVVRRS